MRPMIKTGDELYAWWSQIFEMCESNKKRHEKTVKDGIMVTSAVRRAVLTSSGQGKIILQGQCSRLLFTDLKGGVWKCSIENMS